MKKIEVECVFTSTLIFEVSDEDYFKLQVGGKSEVVEIVNEYRLESKAKIDSEFVEAYYK